MIKQIKILFDRVLNILFPPKCYICKSIDEDPICQNCLSSIKLSPSPDSAFIYEGTIKKAIKALKFRKKLKLAPVLGTLFLEHLPFNDFDCIIPVPLHKERFKQRGFNQSELIARQIAEQFNIPILTDVLVRTRNTKPQFELGHDERENNVKEAFAVINPRSIKDKNILLVDDIMTTGITLKECAETLNKAGAKKVDRYTLSVALLVGKRIQTGPCAIIYSNGG